MSSGRPDSTEIVDATVLAARDATLAERFRLADLPRLMDLIASPDSEADLQARFHWVDGRCGIAGQVTATLRAICQRCLLPTPIEVDDRFHVVLVKSEAEMNELPDTQDSMIADAAHLDLAWLTEEQLLLAMPLVPLHADGKCGSQFEPQTTDETPDKQTPFAQLRELMKKQ
jgi:uncharacterized protein